MHLHNLKNQLPQTIVALPRPRYHSRHIPRELVDFDTVVGQEVRDNGLCDTLEPDMLSRLADLGVTVIETRAVWWEMEPSPGVFDHSRVERALDAIERAGMQAGVFAWFQHPPTWYDPQHQEHTRFRCLEHDTSSTIISQWDPRTLEIYDRLYSELARRMNGRLAFLYAGISGDFGEICYPTGVNHYRFSPPHNHRGFWCSDPQARQSFRNHLQQKYDHIGDVNAAWNSSFGNWQDDLMPTLPIAENPLPRRYDFAQWYTDSLLQFTDQACAIVRRHFPDTTIGIPLGFADEPLVVGQIKSRAAKITAQHGMVARWTGMAFEGTFDRSSVPARRFSTAARYYGAPFATEAALTLSKESAADGLYESMANAAEIIHDDPQNILRAHDVHARLRPRLLLSPPRTRAVVLYPLLNELLEIDSFELEHFMQEASALRRRFDYEICDHCLIDDGFLKEVWDLFVLVSTHVPSQTLPALEAFAQDRGRIWLHNNSELSVLHEDGRSEKALLPLSRFEGNVATSPPGLYRVTTIPDDECYQQLQNLYGPGYYTIHADYVSRYQADTASIEIITDTDAPTTTPGASL